MVLPENSSMHHGAYGRHGIYEIAGPHLVGGVDFLIPRTALFRDLDVRTILDSHHRFEAFLEFRDQACKLAATQLVSMKSHDELFLLTKDDAKLFGPLHAEYMAIRDQKTFLGDKGDGSLAANIPDCFKKDIKLFKDVLFRRLNCVRRYYAYRKGLLKLDFIQSNSDAEEVLKRLKTSTRWSEMEDHELKRGLESHMYLLKELERNKVMVSEREDVAMEKINLELSSELEDYIARYDFLLIDHYFKRTRYMNLARECGNQAQMTGIIFLEEALPIRAFSKEQMLCTAPNVTRLPYFKQTVKQAFEGSMGSLHRMNERFRSTARWKFLFLFSTFTTVAAWGNRRLAI